MRWPNNADVTALRQHSDNRSRFYLGVQKGKERTSNCATFGGAGSLFVGCHYLLAGTDAYNNAEHMLVFGTPGILAGTDIRPGMTLAVGTLADPFAHGSARIRHVSTAPDIIYLEPNDINAAGNLVVGDYIWVDGVYRLYRILPFIDPPAAPPGVVIIYEDGNRTSAGAAPLGNGIAWAAGYIDRPVALMGSPRFAWTGETIDFYGWRSFARGATAGVPWIIWNWFWNFDGGICTGPGVGFPGSPASPIHVHWNAAGEYVASLTVTDNSGKPGSDAYGVPFNKHVAVRPVLVYDRPGEGPNTPYTNFEVNSLSGSYGSGWTMRATVFGTADKSEFPDNALVILFCEDWYGGIRHSEGGWYGQEGILFCGYIRSDSVRADYEKSTVSFEAQTIEQWASEIDCWPVNFYDPGGAPAGWHQYNPMTIEDILWFLAEQRSTLKNITDCFFCSDPNGAKLVRFLDLTEASLYDQMSNQTGSCFFGKLSASRHGSVHLSKHKNMLDMGERTLWGPPVWVFSKQDWRDELEIGEERMRDSVAQVDFIGFIYDANGNAQEVWSLAPRDQGNFGRIEKVTGILLSGNTILAAQPEANALSGLYRAKENTRFPHIRIPAHNNRFLEPATLDYFSVNLAAADTIRGYTWAGKEFLCTNVTYEIDQEAGYILADITGEASTWGPPGEGGSSGEYPIDVPPAPVPPNAPEYWDVWPPPTGALPGSPPPWAPPPAFASVATWEAAYVDVNGIYTTVDVDAGPPAVWNPVLGGNFIFDFDLWQDTVWAADDRTIYRSLDAMATWTSWFLPDPVDTAGDGVGVATWGGAILHVRAIRIDPSSNGTRVFAIIENATANRVWVFRTTNATAANPTWTSQEFNTTLGGWNNEFGDGSGTTRGVNGLHIASNGDIWVMIHANPIGGRQYLFLSIDNGINYTEQDIFGANAVGGTGFAGGGVTTLPSQPMTAFLFGEWFIPAGQRLYRGRSRGAAWTNLTASVANEIAAMRGDPFVSHRLVGYCYTPGSLEESRDQGTTWIPINTAWPAPNADLTFHPYRSDRLIASDVFVGGAGAPITLSNDGGATFTSPVGTGTTRCPRVLFSWKW